MLQRVLSYNDEELRNGTITEKLRCRSHYKWTFNRDDR